MNVKLLRRIQKHILAEPKRYQQGIWLDQKQVGENAPPCGTVACIAGWACVISGKQVDGFRCAEVATRLLDLEPRNANKLFAYPDLTDGYYWPKKFAAQFHKAKTARGRVGAAIRRIDHFIKTKGAE